MNITRGPRAKGIGFGVAALVVAGLSTGIGAVAGAAGSAVQSAPPEAAEGFPRTVEHDGGTAEIPAAPERIVVASVSLGGTLLAIDAPVVAVGTSPSPMLSDEHGFFKQWAEVAVERGVAPLSGPEVDVEEVAAQDPDLIIGTATGGDAVIELYDLLSEVAPTLVYDVSGSSWQDATTRIAADLGLAVNAEGAIAEYDSLAATISESITLPSSTAVAFVYNPDGTNVFTPESAQGALLASLGFEVVTPETSTGEMGQRSDIVTIGDEELPDAVGDHSVFLVFTDETATVAELPVLAATPAITEGRIFALGFESFRLDFYSASLVLERIGELLGAGAPATTAG